MKRLIYLPIAALLVLAACSQPEGTAKELINQRQQLMSSVDSLVAEIAKMDEQLNTIEGTYMQAQLDSVNELAASRKDSSQLSDWTDAIYRVRLDKLNSRRDAFKTGYGTFGELIGAIEKTIADTDVNIKKRILTVTTDTVALGMFVHKFEVQGVVETDQNITVFPEAAGKIISIKVKEGQRVNRGDLMVQLDTDVIRRNIEQVQSSLKLATTVYERQVRLWDQNIGSEIQLLEAENNKVSLEKQLATLRAQEAMSSVRAPFTGVVDEIFPKVGEMAAPQAPLLRLVNLDAIYIKTDISERYLGQITEGTEVEIAFPSLPDTVIMASISTIGNFINPNNRTFKARIDLNQNGGDLKPNLLGNILIKDFTADSTVIVPSRMIQQDAENQNYLFVVVPGEKLTVRKQVIQTGMSYGTGTHVTGGLSPNDVYVDEGARSVRNGDQVKLLETDLISAR
ncbi:MAG: efflux RND transporter periplasmic adaptor subunit [Salibacteraceae bacterium]